MSDLTVIEILENALYNLENIRRVPGIEKLIEDQLKSAIKQLEQEEQSL